MNPHRGLLHHLILVVSDLSRSAPFYGAIFPYLGYELGDSSATFQDWKRWDLGTPHEISIVQVSASHRGVPHVRGAVGHHHHLAFCAANRAARAATTPSPPSAQQPWSTRPKNSRVQP